MRLLSRSLLGSVCLALVLMSGAVHAEGAPDRLRAIAKEAEALLQLMTKQLRELQYRSMSNDAARPSGGRVFSTGTFTIMDLQRSAQKLVDLAGEANSRAATCDKGVRGVARDFQSQARRVNTATNRLANAREQSSTTLTLDQIDFSLQRAYGLLPALGGITECSAESETGEAGESDEPQDPEKKKEEDKGTEDYNEQAA